MEERLFNILRPFNSPSDSYSKEAIFKKSIEAIRDVSFLGKNTGFIIPTRFKDNFVYGNYALLTGAPCFFYNNSDPSQNDHFFMNVVERFSIYIDIINSLNYKESISTYLNSKTTLLQEPVIIQIKTNEISINGNKIKLINISLIQSFNNIYNLFKSKFKAIEVKSISKNLKQATIDNYEDLFSEIEKALNIDDTFNLKKPELITKFKTIAESLFNSDNNDRIIKKISKPNVTEEDMKVFFILLVNLYFFSIKSGLTYNYYIPSVTSSYKKTNTSYDSGYGTLVLSSQKKLYKKSLQNLKFITNSIWSHIGMLDQEDLIKEISLHATRAAISQVMARNMSHNIGSHVLSKLITEDAVNQIFFKNKSTDKNRNANKTKSLEFNDFDFYQCINKIKKVDWENNDNIINTKISNYKLIADFYNYLKTRMDYLADVTTSNPVIENTKGFYCDIVKPFIQNRLLNDRISGISDFKYEVILCKPSQNSYQYCCDNLTKSCQDIIDSKNSNNDIHVSIPNDIVGNQAFYTILENIIRNTAKHAVKVKDTVEFKIKVQEANKLFNNYAKILSGDNLNEYYAVSIFDNCELTGDSNIENWSEEKKKKADLEKDCIGIPRIKELVIDQNEHLNKSILENNQLRHGAWGLIEMDASAAYLRKLSVEQIDSEDYNIQDVTGISPVTTSGKLCIFQAYVEQNKYLGYRFFVRKPREILIISEDKQSLIKNGKSIDELETEGIWIRTTNEIGKVIDSNTALPFRLIVVTPSASKIVSKIQFKPLFSKRIVTVDGNFNDFSNKDKMWDEFYREKSSYSKKLPLKAHHDNHGENYCDFIFNKVDNFVEMRFSATDHFFNEPYFKYSWPIKIGIIDERIQAFGSEKYPIQEPSGGCSIGNDEEREDKCFHKLGGVPYREIYKNTNILLPITNDCNLNSQTFDCEFDKILEYVRKCSQNIEVKSEDGNGLDNFPCEFIVIHLGVIEKLIAANNRRESKTKIYDKEKPEEVDDFIKKIILKFDEIEDTDKKKEVYDSIVLTSGRGKPHNLPEDIRYLNFSAVSQYLTTQRNKFALTEVLYSARSQFKN